MKITGPSLIQDYQALRQAALSGQSEVEVGLNMLPVEVLGSQLDNDPATTDTLEASAWDGSFSSQPARLSFVETQQDGRQVLEFSAEQSTSLFSGEVERSVARVDLASGELLSATGEGNFLVSQPLVPPVKPDPLQQEYARIRSEYQQLQQQLQDGQEELSLGGFFQASLSQREPGLIEIKGWDGGMSSPEVTIRYREFEQDGRKMLEYTRSTPANPFMVGSRPETLTHTLPLA